MDWFLPTLNWYLVTLLATIAAMPVTLMLFRRCMGQGAGFARPIAMLAVIWPAWVLSHIVDGWWSAPALWASLVLVGIVGWLPAWRNRWVNRDTLFHYGVAELVFLVLFIAGVWLKGYVPMLSVSGTDTEKPGELMMLSSVMHSTSMPPQDAWFSGHDINYYYLGYALFGGFGKMIGGVPAEVFNLALITTFAMAFVAISGLVAAIVGRFHGEWPARIGGLIAGGMALVIGNPWSSWKVFTGNAGASYWDGIGWDASRVIKDSPDPNYFHPITEFPAFSFVLGDLHPHVMALPFAATALGLGWALLIMGRLREGQSIWQRNGMQIMLAGAAVGSLYALNSWDFPTYAGMTALGLIIGTVGIGWARQLGVLAVFGVSAIVAWLPFYINFHAPTMPLDTPFNNAFGKLPVIGGVLQGLGMWQGETTSPGEFFSIFGFQYGVMLLLMLVLAITRREPVFSNRLRRLGERPAYDPVPQYMALGFGVLCFIGAIVVPMPLLMLCGLPVIVTWLLLERDARLTSANIALVLFALALLLLLVPEFFFINDIFSGSRMNTVFKVSYQVWLLMSVASGIGVIALWRALRIYVVVRYAVPAVVAAMLVVACAYPVVGWNQWLDYRNPAGTWQGIDGLEHLEGGPYDAEVAAIDWLLDNASADDVILTSGGGDWRPDVARVSSAAGVPTLVGWLGHERQWHLGDDAMQTELVNRIGVIDTLYAGPPSPELLDQYGITLLYIGPTELHGANGVQSQPGSMSTVPIPVANDPNYPGPGWELVFEQDGTRIYRRVGND